MATVPAPGIGTRIAVLVGGLLAVAGSAQAVPARPVPIPLENADGSMVMGRMFGDEHLSWFEDLSGYAIAFDPASGSWNYAAEGRDGRLVPTRLRAGREEPASAGLTAHLRPGAEAVKAALATRRWTQTVNRPVRSKAVRSLGQARSIKNLVLLVQFSDQTPRFQPSDFEPVFNGAKGSVREYYLEVSYGQFDLSSVIVAWVPLPKPASAYAYNDRMPNGRPDLMLHDAVEYLNQQSFDFKQFDSDADGYVDAVDVVHSGRSYEDTGNSSYIHSHFAPFDGYYFQSPVTHDGLQFTGYHTEAEYGSGAGDITQIGVICHETAHFFGAPDLYDYGYDSAGLGLWSLMAAGSWGGSGMSGTRPSGPDAYTRIVLGFALPTVLAADQTGVLLTPVENGPTILRLDQGMPKNQYYLLEDRQQIGYDASVPGKGLLIYHVDEGQFSQDNQSRYLVDLEQADGLRELNKSPYERGDASDAWPTATKKDFAPWSKPSSEPYQGPEGTDRVPANIWVTNITRVGSDVSFDVAFMKAKNQGEACSAFNECATGYCVDGFCCDRACAGACEACSKAEGAYFDGSCSVLINMPCDDKKACTENDICTDGVCRGTPKVCPAADACHEAGVCQPEDGTCLIRNKVDGAACDDGDLCTTIDVCKQGTCTGTQPRICLALDSCHVPGTCAPETGRCDHPVADEGTECGERSVCVSGQCTEKPPEPDAGTLPPPKPSSCGNCAAGGVGLSPLACLLVAGLAVRRRRASNA